MRYAGSWASRRSTASPCPATRWPHPMFLSGQVVSVYAGAQASAPTSRAGTTPSRTPLRDARGWQLDRQRRTRASSPTSRTRRSPTSSCTNGARYYVDHAHPEYSSPEVTSPGTPSVWDRAGDAIALESVRLAATGRDSRRSTSTRTTPTARASPTARTRTTSCAPDAFPRHRASPHPVLRDAPGRLRRAGSGRRRPGRSRASSSSSAPTSSRPRSGSRRP